MTQSAESPKYLADTKGRLVPLDMIRPVDLARHELCVEIACKAEAMSQKLVDFKFGIMADVNAFCEMSIEQYDTKWGGQKGNVTLISHDGKYKIVRAMNENITFDERIEAARNLIEECLHDWTSESRSEVRVIIDQAFQVDKTGNISTSRILGLRKLDIQDERWKRAMQAIGDSIQVVDTKAYVRVYKMDDNGKYQPISLDMAAL